MLELISKFMLITVLIAPISGCNQDKDTSEEPLCSAELACETSQDVGGPRSNGDSSLESRRFKMGVGPIPRNFPNFVREDFVDMYEKVSEVGEAMAVQGNWRESIATSGEIPTDLEAFMKFGGTYNYEPIVDLSFFSGEGIANLNMDSNSTNDWTNTEAKIKYREAVFVFLENYSLNYIGLGIEVNTYFQHHPVDFDRYVEFVKELSDEIRTRYPSVKIFVSFQLEKLKGIGDDRFGTDIEEHWHLLDKFDTALDAVAFTTYPFLEYTSVSEIPANYYKEIEDHTNLPILFTEIGWSTKNGGESEQTKFIDSFFDMTNDLNVELATWAFMHDLPDEPYAPITKIGLRKTDGSAKLAWETWKAWKALSIVP